MNSRAHQKLRGSPGQAAFTLFEIMIALAVFALAALGIAEAMQGTIDVAILARDRVLVRTELESRLAVCLAAPPRPGTPRQVKSTRSDRFQIEETVVPYEAKNREGQPLRDLYQLTILAKPKQPGESEKVSVILYHPGPFFEVQVP